MQSIERGEDLAASYIATQFALAGPSWWLPPFYQCFAVSQTPDPTGAWHRYAFLMPGKRMNDYPKFGVWPDGYYMSVNQFNQASLSWGGQGVVVFEREKMLNGQAARGAAGG